MNGDGEFRPRSALQTHYCGRRRGNAIDSVPDGSAAHGCTSRPALHLVAAVTSGWPVVRDRIARAPVRPGGLRQPKQSSPVYSPSTGLQLAWPTAVLLRPRQWTHGPYVANAMGMLTAAGLLGTAAPIRRGPSRCAPELAYYVVPLAFSDVTLSSTVLEIVMVARRLT